MASANPTAPRQLLWCLLLATFLVGCLGSAELQGGTSGAQVPLPGGDTFVPGVGADSALPGDPGFEPEPGVIYPNRAKLTALSNTEYLTSISELIGVSLSPELTKDWTPSPAYSGFEGINWTNINRKFIEDRLVGVEKMVEAALGSSKVMSCTTTTDFAYATCGQAIVERVAKRAFRRPLRADEKTALETAFVRGVSLAQGSGLGLAPLEVLEEGVRAGLTAVFLAPQFIVRGELPPTPDFVGERPLDAYELATKLAFFFRGSVPDDELFSLAESGALTDEAVLDGQIDRLIPSERFAETFMAQWYGIHAFTKAAPGTLDQAMWLEAKLTFQELVRSDAPVHTFLDPGFTYLVPSLATHYGIQGSFAASGTRVETKERGGMLMLGAFLTATSPPLVTSPIRRGKFVQSRVLCKNLPPPPEELQDAISESQASLPPDATPKERIALHRDSSSVCYSCHQLMDPIGLGLEGFDPTGKKRTFYDGDPSKPVETDSELLGVPFKDFEALNALLLALPDVPRCASEKVAIFSLGRVIASTPGATDAALIDTLSAPVDGQPPSLRQVLKRMIRTPAFRTVFHERAP